MFSHARLADFFGEMHGARLDENYTQCRPRREENLWTLPVYIYDGGECVLALTYFFLFPPSTIYTERWNVNIHTERVYISRVHRA